MKIIGRLIHSQEGRKIKTTSDLSIEPLKLVFYAHYYHVQAYQENYHANYSWVIRDLHYCQIQARIQCKEILLEIESMFIDITDYYKFIDNLSTSSPLKLRHQPSFYDTSFRDIQRIEADSSSVHLRDKKERVVVRLLDVVNNR